MVPQRWDIQAAEQAMMLMIRARKESPQERAKRREIAELFIELFGWRERELISRKKIYRGQQQQQVKKNKKKNESQSLPFSRLKRV